MQSSAFGEVLLRLWPHGDQKISGLRAGAIASASPVLAKYGLTTSLLVAYVIGRCSEECGCGQDVVENGNYSAVRITQVWPNPFPTVESSRPSAGNGTALFDRGVCRPDREDYIRCIPIGSRILVEMHPVGGYRGV